MAESYKIPQGLKIQQSEIHGRGLFADRAIRKGEILGYAETVLTKIESDHSIWVEEQGYHEMVCGFRFINHDDNPNVIIYDDLSIVALKKIGKDEELTHNYDGVTA